MKCLALYVATGPYLAFFDGFYESYMKNFLPGVKKEVLLFTDDLDIVMNQSGKEGVTVAYIDALPWPLPTLLRYHHFVTHSEVIEQFDLVYFFNANAEIRKEIGIEVVPSVDQELTLVRHYGFTKTQVSGPDKYPYCRNSLSQAYIPLGEGYHYVMGGFNGGRPDRFLEMSRAIVSCINLDLKSNIIPVWHDESYLNMYCHQMGMGVMNVLTPEYGSDQRTMLPEYDPFIWFRDKETVMGLETAKYSPIKLSLNK